ncbi:lytic transglycosylase domain-containing protein [Yersinia alsatica]|uniref:lytic transglycosylase domain-containing protein n=1 Tax=Yersinia alsatica TaxID=2890317 RepID=UPI001F363C1C|nr:lytic transglycosylase domain-containing protein [Yersinia alsatica]
MAKPWKDVIASPQYQQLPPDQQAAAQEQYFNEVVAPQAGDQAPAAKEAFFSAYPLAATQQQPSASESVGNPVVEAAKGIAQTGANVLNIPIEIANAFKSAGAWAGQAFGGDGTYTPIPAAKLPESMRPKDEYAKLGAEIGPYLIPGVGAEKTAAALGSVAGSGRAERLATKAADMVAENTVGALAQNSSNNDAGSLAGDLALGLTGSMVGRGVIKGAGSIADKIGGMQGIRDLVGSIRKPANENIPLSSQSGVTNSVPVEQGMQDVAASVGAAADRNTASRMSEAAKEVAPRQEVIDAAKSLGIKEDDLLLSHVSGNQAYREFEQALKSVPGSQLAAQEGAVLKKVAKQASELTDAAGALPDKMAMNDKFLTSFQRGISTVQNKSDQLYNQISEAIPKNQPVSADNIIKHLDQKADELGGADFLSPMEKKVYNAVSPTGNDISPPTYARLDNIRKQIGQAIGKNSGPFRDEETGALKQLYANLTADQEQVVKSVGLGEKWDAAKKLIGVRAQMEDSLTGLLGKDLRGDISTKASLAVRNLSKGDAKGFRTLQQDIPSPRIRREVIATSLRDAFSMGSRKENEFHLPGFVDWYQGAKSSGTLPMIERELGKPTAERMRNLFTLSQAVRDAQSSSITTGRLNAFIKQFDAKDGALDKIYRHGKGALATSIVGQIPVIGPTLSYGAVAGMAAKEASRPARSIAADRLLSSPEFRSVVKQSKGKAVQNKGQELINKKMEARILNSKSWEDFYRTLSKEEKQSIARVGVIGWLSGEDDTNSNQN